jgi:hypothetical protein
LQVFISWSFYLPPISATLYLPLIIIPLLLLIRLDFGLKRLDLIVLTLVGLLLVALLFNSFVEAESSGEGANDCGDECCDNEGFLEVFLWQRSN